MLCMLTFCTCLPAQRQRPMLHPCAALLTAAGATAAPHAHKGAVCLGLQYTKAFFSKNMHTPQGVPHASKRGGRRQACCASLRTHITLQTFKATARANKKEARDSQCMHCAIPVRHRPPPLHRSQTSLSGQCGVREESQKSMEVGSAESRVHGGGASARRPASAFRPPHPLALAPLKHAPSHHIASKADGPSRAQAATPLHHPSTITPSVCNDSAVPIQWRNRCTSGCTQGGARTSSRPAAPFAHGIFHNKHGVHIRFPMNISNGTSLLSSRTCPFVYK